jgi:NodT family efflux transporter outer membrane factor (OMF) lipoprotein
MKKNIIKGVALLAVTLSLSSCHIYQKYELPTDNAVINDYAKVLSEPQDSTTLGNLSWEEVFTDPLLQSYIRQALSKNVDLDNARRNVDVANAQLKGAKLSYLPSLTFTPNGGSASYGGSHMNWSYTLPLNASWEVDIFGKILNKKRAAEVSRDMTIAYEQAAQSQIICAVAKCYYTLVMLNQQLDLMNSTAVIWEDQVRSMKLMKDAGRANEAAVVQSQANYHSILAQIPDIESSIHQTQNALSLLLCSYPQTWAVNNQLEFSLPTMIYEGGIPMSYLAIRPDVRAAEKSFAAAYYATNQARTNFYPTLAISASGGFTNLLGSIITNPGKWFIQVAGQLTAPIFMRGQNIAALEAAKAQQQIALNNFQYAVLNAASEVSDALMEIKSNTVKQEALALQIDDLEKSVEYTKLLFSTSDATYLELLTARSSLLSAQMSALSSWYSKVNALIYLYQAVGGGK